MEFVVIILSCLDKLRDAVISLLHKAYMRCLDRQVYTNA